MLRTVLLIVVGVAVVAESISFFAKPSQGGFQSTAKVAVVLTAADGSAEAVDEPTQQWFKSLFLSEKLIGQSLKGLHVVELANAFGDSAGDAQQTSSLVRAIQSNTTIQFDRDASPTGVMATIHLRSADASSGSKVLAALIREFAEYIEVSQPVPAQDEIARIEATLRDKVLPRLEAAELAYRDYISDLPPFQEGAPVDANEQSLKKEIDRLVKLQQSYLESASKLMIAEADEPRLVFKVLSDGIATKEVTNAGPESILLGTRVLAIAAVVFAGVSASRRRSRS